MNDSVNRDVHGNPINPTYGTGSYRRRVKLERCGDSIRGEMEDSYHGFCVTVTISQGRVAAITPEYKRYPFNTCPSSAGALKNLLGVDTRLDLKHLNRVANPPSNCTHLLDLTILCIQHSQQQQSLRQFDVEIKDEADGYLECKVWCDDRLLHHWLTAGVEIHSPQTLEGKPLRKGFAQWANQSFTDLKLQAAFILQKGHFVAQGRRIDIDALAGEMASGHPSMLGACHTYTPEIAKTAYRLPDTGRDFSHCPEQLLSFK